ncbi:MAG: UDP-2,3-diacylglucosamine diphosphatase LpxI [Rickettsiaceae bacterium]|nr:UDP-2,3-diacylglucosamine diphosphatase LpxI [Rickettsiaceae bacterium]
MASKLGIIAGGGDLPREIARIQVNSGGECFIAALDPDSDFGEFSCQKFSLGSVGSVIDYFKSNSVENIIVIGGIKRPEFSSLKVDFAGAILLAKILKNKVLGDDVLLKTVIDYIESKGLRVISPQEILKLSQYEDMSGSIFPSSSDNEDIDIGVKVMSSLGEMDVGQSVIVANGYVVGIEAAEGTDNLIKRCGDLRVQEKGGVLVKMSKITQDMRVDVPVIGPNTISLLAKHGFNGVAIEKEGVIIINPKETKILLEENNLFLKFI